jgi:hypothetical protein
MLAVNLLFWSFLTYEIIETSSGATFIDIWMSNTATLIWGIFWILSCIFMISCPCLFPFAIYQLRLKPRKSTEIAGIFPTTASEQFNFNFNFNGTIRVGDRLKAQNKLGDWSEAVVLEQTDEYVKVKFDGKSEEFDEWIKKNQGKISTCLEIAP